MEKNINFQKSKKNLEEFIDNNFHINSKRSKSFDSIIETKQKKKNKKETKTLSVSKEKKTIKTSNNIIKINNKNIIVNNNKNISQFDKKISINIIKDKINKNAELNDIIDDLKNLLVYQPIITKIIDDEFFIKEDFSIENERNESKLLFIVNLENYIII